MGIKQKINMKIFRYLPININIKKAKILQPTIIIALARLKSGTIRLILII